MSVADEYVFVLEEYVAGEGYRHLVHHVRFEQRDDGWWGLEMLCTRTIIDGGKLPVRYNHLSRGLDVTCLRCLTTSS